MRIEENLVSEMHPDMRNYCNCPDCHKTLDWDDHNKGEIGMEYWIAFCRCNKGQRMWTIRPHTMKFSSING
jgi:hypothetical protein